MRHRGLAFLPVQAHREALCAGGQGRAKGQSSMAMQRGSDHGASDPLQTKAGQGSVGCAVSPGPIPSSIPVDISLATSTQSIKRCSESCLCFQGYPRPGYPMHDLTYFS